MKVISKNHELKSKFKLEQLLTDTSIDYNNWTSKTVDQLLTEILNDECIIGFHETYGLTRSLSIGICQIKHPSEELWLRETSRIITINDISIDRSTNLPMSGKLRQRKPVHNEMMRELMEELSLPYWASDELNLIKDFEDTQVIEKPTNSYIGLTTIYNRHVFNLVLPECFIKDEYVEIDGNKTCTFGWDTNKPNLK